MDHYAVRSGRYSRQNVLKVRSMSRSPSTVNSKQRSANSRRITIRRVPLSPRYTTRSARTTKSLAFPSAFFVVVVVLSADVTQKRPQATLKLRVQGHFSPMRGPAGREALFSIRGRKPSRPWVFLGPRYLHACLGRQSSNVRPHFLRSISLAPVSQLAVINVSLNNTPGANIRSHDFILDSFTRWDQSRERSGEGQWDFTFHVSRPGESTDFLRTFLAHFCVCGNLIWFTDKGTGPLSPSRTQRHEVKPVIQTLQNVCIPTSALTPRPNPRSTSTGRRGRRDLLQGETDADEDDAMQDWNERANSLFEWIGMVNIGAQRHVLLSCFP